MMSVKATNKGVIVTKMKPSPGEFFSLNGVYTIAPETSEGNLFDDANCLLGQAQTIIQTVIEGMSNPGSQMTANAQKDVPSLLFSALHQLEMVENLVNASLSYEPA